MYNEHFKIREAPFSLTPDTEYYYNFKSHQEALNVLNVALESGEGIIKIIGEVGTGKTLLCRKMMNALAEKHQVFYIPNPLLDTVALYQSLTEALGIRIFLNMTLLDMTGKMTEALSALSKEGKKFIVCIDEAQALPRESLEALRLLSNLETEKQKLLQIILFAQPELDKVLEGNDLRQIRQRISFSYYLQALDRSAVAAYINYRLYVAGYTDGSLFDDAAVEAIYRSSRGIPRLVNTLCHKAMMVAYGMGLKTVELPQVMMASRDTEEATPLSSFNLGSLSSYYYPIGIFVLLGMAIVVARLWSAS